MDVEAEMTARSDRSVRSRIPSQTHVIEIRISDITLSISLLNLVTT